MALQNHAFLTNVGVSELKSILFKIVLQFPSFLPAKKSSGSKSEVASSRSTRSQPRGSPHPQNRGGSQVEQRVHPSASQQRVHLVQHQRHPRLRSSEARRQQYQRKQQRLHHQQQQ